MRRRQFLSVAAGAALPSLPASRRAAAVPNTLEPLGTVALEGLTEAVVGPGDETVYAATGDGFAVVDVSDPAAPTVLAQRRALLADRENGPLRGIQDVKVDGDLLAVVGPANPARGPTAALFYDVADPASPRRLGVYETDFPIHNCDVADGVAYLTGNRGYRSDLELVAAGSNPELLGSWSIADVDERWLDVLAALRPLHDVSVRDGRAAVAHWDAGTWLVDVSDPRSPSLVARVRGRTADELASLDASAAAVESLEPPGNDHYATENDDGSLLGIGAESWDVTPRDDQGGPGGIDLYGVSSATEPRQVGRIDPPPTAAPGVRGGVWTTSHNFDFAGERLYTSWYRGGVRVFDVADPADPTALGVWRDPDAASFWTAQAAGDVFVAASREGGEGFAGTLYVFADPPADAGPVETATEPVGATPTPTPTPPPTATSTASRTPTSGADGPGFGALGALGGLGLGYALRRWRR